MLVKFLRSRMFIRLGILLVAMYMLTLAIVKNMGAKIETDMASLGEVWLPVIKQDIVFIRDHIDFYRWRPQQAPEAIDLSEQEKQWLESMEFQLFYQEQPKNFSRLDAELFSNLSE